MPLEINVESGELTLTEEISTVSISEQAGAALSVIQPAPPYVVEIVNGIEGPKGDKGDPGADSTVPGPEGPAGPAGDSAYQVALDNGFVGTEQQWLDSIVGADGMPGTNGSDGADGLSAYEIAVAEGFVGTETEWLASLKGDKGDQGPAGADGADGAPGTVDNEQVIDAVEDYFAGNPAMSQSDFALYGVLVTKYWDGSAWPTRTVPAGYTGPVVWDSSADSAATQPTNAIEGDRWVRNVVG